MDVIDVSSETDARTRLGVHVTGQTLAVEHHVGVELVLGAERAGLGVDVTRGGRGGLNFGQRAVFAEDRQGVGEDLAIGTPGLVGRVVADELRAGEVWPVRAGWRDTR